MLVSLCIPTYNGVRYLRECLESVKKQTFRDFELLIVDDASTDGTVALVRRVFGRDPRLRLIVNKKNVGLVANWNRCVSLACGEWLKFLFQDDVLRPSCLERLLDARRGGAPLVVCRRAARFEAGTPAGVKAMYLRHFREHSLDSRFPERAFVSAGEFSRLMLRFPGYNCIGEPTSTLVERSAFARFGPFNEALVTLCDWEFWARAAVNGGLAFTPECLATFRVHARAASSANRTVRRYQAEVIDELILRHELAYGKAFAPVRRAARSAAPPADLEANLTRAAVSARALAESYAQDAVDPDPNARAAWRKTLKRYPRLAAVLGSQGAARGARLRRTALKLLQSL